MHRHRAPVSAGQLRRRRHDQRPRERQQGLVLARGRHGRAAEHRRRGHRPDRRPPLAGRRRRGGARLPRQWIAHHHRRDRDALVPRPRHANQRAHDHLLRGRPQCGSLRCLMSSRCWSTERSGSRPASPHRRKVDLPAMALLARSGSAIALAEVRESDAKTVLHYFPATDFSIAAQTLHHRRRGRRKHRPRRHARSHLHVPRDQRHRLRRRKRARPSGLEPDHPETDGLRRRGPAADGRAAPAGLRWRPDAAARPETARPRRWRSMPRPPSPPSPR